MTVRLRNYIHSRDYQHVSEFLISNHQPGNTDGNWLEPAWEYMHFHPCLQPEHLGKIGLWETGGRIVAVVHYECSPGEAFFQFDPAYGHLRNEMLEYAEANLWDGSDDKPADAAQDLQNARNEKSADAETNLQNLSSKETGQCLHAFINDNDQPFLDLIREKGYQQDESGTRPLYRFDIPDPFPEISLAEGFRLTSLAEECDWAKVHQVIWRGFDHGDNVPMTEEELTSRQKMFDTPRARRDLKIAVAAPNGEFAAFCGMFFDSSGKFAYVEPVATDPRYRRLGLGRAAVLEGIRRCSQLGAVTAYVGSSQPFYLSLGFQKVFNSEYWVKCW